MKLVIQRVSQAQVSVNEEIVGKINHGAVVLIGVHENDTHADVNWLILKLINLRIFPDENGQMNRSIIASNGKLLLISQFTLLASIKKGNRPSFVQAAKPEQALLLFNFFVTEISKLMPQKIEKGVFGANMQVNLTNDGPVTIVIDSNIRN